MHGRDLRTRSLQGKWRVGHKRGSSCCPRLVQVHVVANPRSKNGGGNAIPSPDSGSGKTVARFRVYEHARQSRVPVEVAGRRERSCSCDGGCRETESHLAAPFRYNGTLAPINRLPLLLSLPRALPSLFPASTTSFSARLVLFCIPRSVERAAKMPGETGKNG